MILHDGKTEPRYNTTVKMCRDEQCIYILFHCEDGDIWGTYCRRDDPIFNEEVVEVFISPDGSLKHYYEINVSPRGVVFDSWIHNSSGLKPDKKSDSKWNCNELEATVRVHGTVDKRDDVDKYWTVEMKIPFASLDQTGGKTPEAGDTWRMNLYRIDRTPHAEYSCWSPTLVEPVSFHVPAKFGKIVFD